MSRRIEAVRTWWQGQASRRVLWLPVLFAAGIATYFALPVEPVAGLLPGLCIFSASASLLVKRQRLPLVLLTLVLAGAAWANITTRQHEGVVLREALTPRPVMGHVTGIERTEQGVRLTLERVTIANYPAERSPLRVRISLRLKADSTLALPHIGDVVTLMAGLRPPMGPALPHGFDFARYFYFRDIGAVGFGMPPWEIIGERGTTRLSEQFWDWRIRLTENIIGTLGRETGGVAAGLITGDAKAITETDFEALRASNLYHIIAISGEHMVVIAGVIFISLRLLALLLPRHIAFRPQIKSAAAVLTLLLVTAYLFVTGLPISAVRAYVMIFLVLLAVILRRQVDAMRSLAIAAFLMLLADPASLLEPGFRLSFAATLAIIALVEARLLRAPFHASKAAGFWHLFLTMLLVSVVAEAATMPLVIAMFNNFSLYGVAANMLATPLVSFFLMPAVALYFILLPLGLSHWALAVMDAGIRALLGLAHFIASLPHAQFFVPSLPGYGIALFVLGLLWLCLWRGPVRRYGAAAILLAMATLWIPTPPDMLMGGELKQIAFREGAEYRLARGRKNSMVPELWANGLGYATLEKPQAPAWRCDSMGCIAEVKGARVAFPKSAAAIAQDCAATTLLFTPLQGVQCEDGAAVIGQEALNGSNVIALWVNDGSLRVERSADWQGSRPWRAVMAEEDAL